MNRLDRKAIRIGALADLAVLVPLVVLYVIIRAAGSSTAGTGVIVAATVVAPFVGGFTAGRHQMSAPLTNGAAAAAVAVVAYIAFRLVDASVRGGAVHQIHPASVVIFVMLSVTLGLLGGFAGFRTAKR